MKFKKFIALGLGLVTAVSALTACSGGASGSKDTKEGDISGEIISKNVLRSSISFIQM